MYLVFPTVTIEGRIINPSKSVQNFRLLTDNILSFSNNINVISKSANFYLRKIPYIRIYYLDHIINLLNSLLLSRFDYRGSIYYDIKYSKVEKVDRIIRCTTRLLFKLKRYYHNKTDMTINAILNVYY